MNQRRLRSRLILLGLIAPLLAVLGLVGACKIPHGNQKPAQNAPR